MRCFRTMLNLPTLVLLSGFGLWEIPCAQADLYQWTDAAGVIHVADDAGTAPTFNDRPVKVYRSEPSLSPGERVARSPNPPTGESRVDVFATKLALDLGLIKQRGEDAFGALRRVEIIPVGGWNASAPLTPEIFYEVLAAARRAANAGRLSLSADGAEAVVRAAMTPLLSAPVEAPASQYSFVEPENEAATFGEEPYLLYEQRLPLVEEWSLGWLYGGPVVVIVRRPLVPRVPRFPLERRFWRRPQSISPLTFPAPGLHVSPWQGLRPAFRGGLPGPRLFHPLGSGMTVGTRSTRLSFGSVHGGFSHR